jgi:hypothetical protein
VLVALAAVLDAFGKGEAPGGAQLPPCLVLEAGDYSLAEWPAKRARCAPPAHALFLVTCSNT